MYIKPIQYRQFIPYGTTVRSTDRLEELLGFTYRHRICRDTDAGILTAYPQPVYIEPASGVSMLIVRNKERSEAFLFARPVCIAGGVYFCVIPYGCRECSYHEYVQSDPSCVSFDKEPYLLSTKVSFSITNIYTFLYSEKKSNYVFAGERHPFWELMYVDRGQIDCTVEGERYPLKAGDLIIYHDNEFHALKARGKNMIAFLNIAFQLSEEQTLPMQRVYHIDTEIQLYFKKMVDEAKRAGTYAIDMMAAYLKLVFVHLMAASAPAPAEPLSSTASTKTHSTLVGRVKGLVEEHLLDRELSVAFIAEQMHISSSYLYRVFTSSEKISLQLYILDRKLQKAKDMIALGDHTMTEISEQLNFCSPTYFSTQFKKAFGCTPREYSRSVCLH